MAINFSPEQLSAINTRDKTLLVSAAAGSGKTATLTERILRSLLDEENPASISDMLIVTFTNASAADLREKISKTVRAAVKENPKNKRLERELFLLPSARICTIDSFCNEVLRANADTLGITSGYRLCETAEAAILSSSLLNALIDAAYEGELSEIISPEDFEEMCDCLTSSKQTDKLAEVFLSLYNKSKSALDGVGIFESLANNYLQDGDFKVEEVFFGKYIMEGLSETCHHFLNQIRKIETELSCDFNAPAPYSSVIESDKELLEGLCTAKSYETVKEILEGVSFERMPTKKAHSPHIHDTLRAVREKMKDALTKERTRFFSYTSNEWRELYKNMHRVLGNLARFLKKFDTLYTEEKKRRAMLEYSDIERYAYFCLRRDGEITDVARSYREKFTSVYIDEYQDVNSLQNAIFEAISKPNNRFMVGDIKQSIYGFRSAKPEIFAQMKADFPPLEKAEDSPSASIFMSKNYRCDEAVIDFVNEIFDSAFGILGKSIGYVKEDRLLFAKTYDEGEIPTKDIPTVMVSLGEEEENPEQEPTENVKNTKKESDTGPTVVAKKIKELLDFGKLASGEPIQPNDVAIILRKRDRIADYTAALSALGISAESSDDKNFFLNAEVLLALCLLNTVDNPHKDVYLAGLMCSPLYSFTADDLLTYRQGSGAVSLYEAVGDYCKLHPEDNKPADFLRKLAYYRLLAEGTTVDTLIAKLYRETGLLALASKSGGKENLLLLYNYAKRYEGSSFKGLYNFVNYVNNLISINAAFPQKREESGTSSVKILTIHSSKGLEFPVVFLAEAQRPLINLDSRDRIAYAEDFGLSLCLRAPGGLALVNNPVQYAVRDYMNVKYFEEELRVLYVALTRARERLFVVGATDIETEEEYRAVRSFEHDTLSPYSLKRMKSYLDIISATAISTRYEFSSVSKEEECEEKAQTLSQNGDTAEIVGAGEADGARRAISVADSENTLLKEQLKMRFSFVYPKKHDTTLPEKLSVSALYPTVLDGSEGAEGLDEGRSAGKISKKRDTLPSFMSGSRSDESALRGIATHLFLQFFDLDSLSKNGVSKELSRLELEGYISKENATRVRQSEIELFKKSKLFSDMKSARRLYREFRFNSRLPADKFTEDKERAEAYADREILVQGVIDCIIEDEHGELHLVDYKTDRLTKEELSDKTLAQKVLAEKHRTQLFYYALAAEKIFGKRPKTLEIYSLPLGDTVSVSIES